MPLSPQASEKASVLRMYISSSLSPNDLYITLWLPRRPGGPTPAVEHAASPAVSPPAVSPPPPPVPRPSPASDVPPPAYTAGAGSLTSVRQLAMKEPVSPTIASLARDVQTLRDQHLNTQRMVERLSELLNNGLDAADRIVGNVNALQSAMASYMEHIEGIVQAIAAHPTAEGERAGGTAADNSERDRAVDQESEEAASREQPRREDSTGRWPPPRAPPQLSARERLTAAARLAYEASISGGMSIWF